MNDQSKQRLVTAYHLVLAARNVLEAVWGDEVDAAELAMSAPTDPGEANMLILALESNVACLEGVMRSLQEMAPDEIGEE